MSSEEVRKLLSGYATGTLTEAERSALFEASLQDPQLFEALADEQALKEMLDDPQCRAELLQSLEIEDEISNLVAHRVARSSELAALAPEETNPAPVEQKQETPVAPPPPPPHARRSPWWGWLQPAPVAVALSLLLTVFVVYRIRQPRASQEVQIVAQKPAQTPDVPRKEAPASPALSPRDEVGRVAGERAKGASRPAPPPPALARPRAGSDQTATPPVYPPQEAPSPARREEPAAATEAKELEKSERRDAKSAVLSQSGTQEQVQVSAAAPQAPRAVADQMQTRPSPPAANLQIAEKASEAGLSYVVFRREPDKDWAAATPNTRFAPGDKAKIEIRTVRAMSIIVRNAADGRMLASDVSRPGARSELPLNIAFDKGPVLLRLSATPAPEAMALRSSDSVMRAKTSSAQAGQAPGAIVIDIPLNTTTSRQ